MIGVALLGIGILILSGVLIIGLCRAAKCGDRAIKEVLMPEQVPSIGRVVHYVLPDGPHAGEHRPAFIVQMWSGNYVNLQVFVDGTNDYPDYSGSVWATSIEHSEEPKPRTWHWPEFVPAADGPR